MDFTSTNLKRALMISAIFFIFGGLALFTYFSFLHAVRISEEAVVKNHNTTSKQYLSFLKRLEFDKWKEESQLLLMQEICNEFNLNFNGFFFVIDRTGNVIVKPENVEKLPNHLNKRTFINLANNSEFNVSEIETPIVVNAKLKSDKVQHYVSFVPLSSDFFLMVHTDFDFVIDQIKNRYYPMGAIALIVAIITVTGLIFFTRRIFLDYEFELAKSNKAISKLYRKQARISDDRKQFLHILSHDLHNPFAGIISANDLYEHELAEIDEVMEMVKNSALQGLETIALVRQLLAIESDKLQLNIQSYNLVNLINESLAMLRQIFINKEINVDVKVDKEINILVDKTSFINSVLNNCLTNAFKFSFKGGTVTIDGENLENEFVLKVCDKGIGIPDDLAQKLFDINAKTSRVGTGGEKGTGFGMPLVKMLVNSYGGTINIDSSTEENESGTIISLTLKKPAL